MTSPNFVETPRRLGFKEGEASPGPHQHTGEDGSKKLLAGKILTGDRSDGTALANLITLLSEELGFTNSTVA